MTRLIAAAALPLLASLAACNVERDPANDTTTLSVDEQKVEGTLDQAGNLAESAAEEVQEAARNAAPVIEDAARDAGNAAEHAGRTIEAGAEGAAQGIREETRDNPPPANNQ